MAQKQTAHDAVSAAMSAIEDALNLSSDEVRAEGTTPPVVTPAPATGQSPAPAKPLPAAPGGLAPPAKAAPALEPSETPLFPRRQPLPPEEAKPTLGAQTPPANDDRAAIGPIVQAMQSRRPSRAPFAAAAVAAVAWLALCVAYAVSHYPAGGTDLVAARDYALRPETVLLALAALGPTILLFGFAALSHRLQELRLSAGSITQVALRLAEPETVAGEQVATLSQAIRREIASMGDGIERALARAAELETLVRSEVSTLERAYSDNERRIRSLIAEMADQREAIVANGGRVRAALGGAHQEIASDLDKIAEQLSERISNVGERVSTSLGASSEEIAVAMDRAGTATVNRIATQGEQIQETLTAVGEDVAARTRGRQQPKRRRDRGARGRRRPENPGDWRDSRRRLQRPQ